MERPPRPLDSDMHPDACDGGHTRHQGVVTEAKHAADEEATVEEGYSEHREAQPRRVVACAS